MPSVFPFAGKENHGCEQMTKIDWQFGEPPKAKRLLVKTMGQPDALRSNHVRNLMSGHGKHHLTFGRMILGQWVDDHTLPILNVVGWSEVE